MARIYTTDLYNNLSDLASEERSFITDPFLIADIHFLTTVMLFTPASLNACPVLPDGSRSKMFVFRGFWQVVQDTGYVGTRADWDMMPPSVCGAIPLFLNLPLSYLLLGSCTDYPVLRWSEPIHSCRLTRELYHTI